MLSALLTPARLHFTKRQMKDMIAATDIKTIETVLANSYYHKFLGQHGYIDEYTGQFLCKTCRKYMRFSSLPAIVMLSYVYLFELEIEDITNIIEGVRYNMPPEQISRLTVALS